MKELAIMIPRGDATDLARDPSACRPLSCPRAECDRFAFPEIRSLKSDWYLTMTAAAPPWPRDTADLVEKLVFAIGRPRAIIVTRSPIVIVRVQRIIATTQGPAWLKAAVYVAGDKEMTCHPIGPDGSFTWPHGLFLDEWGERNALEMDLRRRPA